ncbi:Microtubule-nucleating Tub4p (gamma-tubulin) complex component [Massospora cicadina]|nr:Microtubule-nucleating Tub4p (gamma-tubulin) complex component [Massospora cicadina]
MSETRDRKLARYTPTLRTSQDTLADEVEGPSVVAVDALEMNIIGLLRSLGFDFPPKGEITNTNINCPSILLSPEQKNLLAFSLGVLKSTTQLATDSFAGVIQPLYRQMTPVREGLVQVEPERRAVASPSPRKRASGVIPEETLVSDLVFIFQGVDGQFIKFNTVTFEPRFEPNVKMTRTAATMVYKLFELGFLYRRLDAYLECEGHFGLVEQSFRAYLHTTLSDYFRLVAALDGREGLTFRRLVVWTYEPLHKLRMFCNLVDAIKGRHGGGLLSALHSFTKHGDPIVQEFAHSVLEVVSLPYHQMVKHWLYDGDLCDPHQEFFVQCNPGVSDENMWKQQYTLRKGMVPAFLDDRLASKIFLVGKSIKFIRHACRCPDYRWAEMPEMNSVTATEIERGYAATSSALQDQLFTNYRLIDHMAALKRYMLLGQGDFIQHLMDLLLSDLNLPAMALHRHNLTAKFETAVRTTNVQYEDPVLLKCLNFQIKPLPPGELGWDAFSLDYYVGAPINTVLNSSAMYQYQNIFSFLWRIKRVELTLSSMWRSHMLASRTLNAHPSIRQDLHLCHAVTAEMIHFVYQFQYYLLFEVLECAWERLSRLLRRRQLDLDGLIEAHASYLIKLGAKSLLSIDKQMTPVLLNILDLIITYQGAHHTLIIYGLTQAADQRKRDGELSFLQPIDHPSSEPIESIRKRMLSIGNDFQSHVRTLVHLLANQPEVDLRSLSFRLNFNEVYSNLPASHPQ